MITFITGSEGKLAEAKQILGEVTSIDIDLPEIQEIDARAVIEAKLLAAQEYHKGEYIVEDTSLYFDAIKGLPGPLIKWFLKTIGNDGLYEIANKLGKTGAQAKVIIGHISADNKINYFEGTIDGDIAKPKGNNGFGWDPIFKPKGYAKTFSEMNDEEKNKISMRRIALEKLRNFLDER